MSHSHNGMPQPTVTVVIPTYRRDDLLMRCLGGVLQQDYPPECLQVIVVDDADSEETPVAAEEVAADYPDHQVLVLGSERKGPAAARNVGWEAATGDVIAFIDDDAYPADRNWIREGVRMLVSEGAPAVSGQVIVPMPETPTDAQRNTSRLEEGAFLTCNAFVRRETLARVGGFDERFRVPFREDSDLQFRIEDEAGPVLRSPEARVVHPANRGKFAESLKRQKYVMYNALLYAKHPDRYRREIEAAPPWSYYAMTGLLVAAAVAFIRRWPVAWVALALWAVLDGRLLARRVRGTERSPRHLADMVLTTLVIPPLGVFWRLWGALKFRVWFV